MDVWLSASSCDGRRPIGRRIAGDMRLWRRTATDRHLVGVELLRVERVLLLRPVATSCRATQGDMSVLASTYVWSQPTWARLPLIATSCSKAAIDLRFGRSEHSCVASCQQRRRNAVDLRLPLGLSASAQLVAHSSVLCSDVDQMPLEIQLYTLSLAVNHQHSITKLDR